MNQSNTPLEKKQCKKCQALLPNDLYGDVCEDCFSVSLIDASGREKRLKFKQDLVVSSDDMKDDDKPLNPEPFIPIVRDPRRRYSHPYVYKEKNRCFWLTFHISSKKGTGPFTTANKAKDYYNRGGR